MHLNLNCHLTCKFEQNFKFGTHCIGETEGADSFETGAIEQLNSLCMNIIRVIRNAVVLKAFRFESLI